MQLQLLFIALIVVKSNVILKLALGQRVCYSREQIDDRNVVARRVPCDEEEHHVYKEYSSKESVNLGDLIAMKCSLSLPNVTNGFFNIANCSGNYEGDVCNMTCRDGYYPRSQSQTKCENNGNNQGEWSNGEYFCSDVKCAFSDVPDVTNGAFSISQCSGDHEGDVCNITCRDHYYPNSQSQTICKSRGNNQGQWTNGDFSCYALNCSVLRLPNVTNGFFNISDCSGNYEGDVCNMTCRDDYYPNSQTQTKCENDGNNQGQWSNGDFSCCGDCYELFTSGFTEDGVYTIKPTGWTGSPFQVYCNMSHGGGWTVFQRRVNGSVDFQFRGWDDYKEGFGIPSHELWLGNEKLFFFTNQRKYKLRIDVVDRDGIPYYMNYDLFRVSSENSKYQLEKLDNFTGNTDFDYMAYHKGRAFSTRDRDNDGHNSLNCALHSCGGWWYGKCYSANLNGDYNSSGDASVSLYLRNTDTHTFGLRYTQMKIRPI